MNQDFENIIEFLKILKDPMDIFAVLGSDGLITKEYQQEYQQWLEQKEAAQ